jgi:hypothetical protein
MGWSNCVSTSWHFAYAIAAELKGDATLCFHHQSYFLVDLAGDIQANAQPACPVLEQTQLNRKAALSQHCA